jgi:hypothetical protein
VLPQPGGGAVKEWTIAVSVVYSLALAAGGAYVFYASIRPVSIPTGYFAGLADFPWEAAYLSLGAVLVIGPVMLLALGIDLRVKARLTWWFVVGWLGALAAGTAIGLLTMHGFGLLFTAYPRALDGSPLGPSRFDPGAPYWRALIAAGGQLAVGAILIALIAALSRKDAGRLPGGARPGPPRRTTPPAAAASTSSASSTDEQAT